MAEFVEFKIKLMVILGKFRGKLGKFSKCLEKLKVFSFKLKNIRQFLIEFVELNGKFLVNVNKLGGKFSEILSEFYVLKKRGDNFGKVIGIWF